MSVLESTSLLDIRVQNKTRRQKGTMLSNHPTMEKQNADTPVVLLPHTTRGQSHSKRAKIGMEARSYPESAMGFRAALSPARPEDRKAVSN